MASPGGNSMPPALSSLPSTYVYSVAAAAAISIAWLLAGGKTSQNGSASQPGVFKSFLLFFYSCFLKPHNKDKQGTGTQQDALESFYAKQAGVYDATRKLLLQGREDMLALVAAQLESKAHEEKRVGEAKKRRIWVDVGLGSVAVPPNPYHPPFLYLCPATY